MLTTETPLACFTIEYSVHLFKLRADWQSLETLYILYNPIRSYNFDTDTNFRGMYEHVLSDKKFDIFHE